MCPKGVSDHDLAAIDRVCAAVKKMVFAYFNKYYTSPYRGNAVYHDFQPFRPIVGGSSSYGICGSVLYSLGDTYFLSDRLHIKYFCSSPDLPLCMRPQPYDSSIELDVEMHFYRKVVPHFNRMRGMQHLVPKLFVGRTQSADGTGVMVFRHAIRFRSLAYTAFLDRSQVSLALHKIAEFHAYSFEARRKNPDMVLPVFHPIHTEHMDLVKDTLRRCLEPLAQAAEFAGCVPRLWDIVDNLETRVAQLMSGSNSGNNVLCHRNFSRANILFHLDERTKIATDLRIVNWQWMGFASLGVDLAILLFVETHPQTLREHWQQLLNAYTYTLRNTFPDTSVPEDDDVRTELIASIPIALYMLGLRANRLHLRTTSPAAIRVSSLLWNESLITEVFKELIRLNFV